MGKTFLPSWRVSRSGGPARGVRALRRVSELRAGQRSRWAGSRPPCLRSTATAQRSRRARRQHRPSGRSPRVPPGRRARRHRDGARLRPRRRGRPGAGRRRTAAVAPTVTPDGLQAGFDTPPRSSAQPRKTARDRRGARRPSPRPRRADAGALRPAADLSSAARWLRRSSSRSRPPGGSAAVRRSASQGTASRRLARADCRPGRRPGSGSGRTVLRGRSHRRRVGAGGDRPSRRSSLCSPSPLRGSAPCIRLAVPARLPCRRSWRCLNDPASRSRPANTDARSATDGPAGRTVVRAIEKGALHI